MRRVLLIVSVMIAAQLSAQYQLNGTATQLSCNCYELTTAINNSAGSVWNVNLIDLNDPFDFTFEVFLGTEEAGADGMAFGLQPNGTGIGGIGGDLGLGGVTPSLGVFLDTFVNAEDMDPNEDHVSINANGNIDHDGSADDLAGPVEVDNLEDGEFHDLNVNWSGSGMTLTVTLDGDVVLIYSGDIINEIFGGDPMVFWGFTASTGGLNNTHQFCTAADIEFDVSMTSVCPGVPVSFADESQVFGSILDWSWDFGDMNTASGSVVSHTFNEEGTYDVTLSVTDEAGCMHEQTIPVVVDFPELEISTDPGTICLGGEATLLAGFEPLEPPDCAYTLIMGDAFGDGWNGNSVDVVVDGQVVQNITLDMGDFGTEEILLQHGTAFSLVFNSDVWAVEVTFSLFDASGDELGQWFFLINGTEEVYSGVVDCGYEPNEYDVVWQDSDVVVSEDGLSATVSPSSTSTYSATLVDQNGCSSEAVIDIEVSDISVSAVSSLADCESATGIIDVTGMGGLGDYDYTIVDSALFSGNGTFFSLYPGEYEVTITDEVPCSQTVSVVVDEFCELEVLIPNVFTPNGDDKNSHFGVELIGGRKPHMSIYNRWGKLLFETSDVEEGWDGQDFSEGTYYYLLQVIDLKDNRLKEFSGNFKLLR